MPWDARFAHDPRLGGIYRQLTGRRLWPLQAAVVVAGTLIVVPLVLIVLAGLLVGGAVYAVASAVAGVIDAVTGQGSAVSGPNRPTATDDSLRENVRVIHR